MLAVFYTSGYTPSCSDLSRFEGSERYFVVSRTRLTQKHARSSHRYEVDREIEVSRKPSTAFTHASTSYTLLAASQTGARARIPLVMSILLCTIERQRWIVQDISDIFTEEKTCNLFLQKSIEPGEHVNQLMSSKEAKKGRRSNLSIHGEGNLESEE